VKLVKTTPSVVYPRLMQPQMLQLSIRVLSERLDLWVMYCKVNPIPLVPIGGIKEEALRLGINKTKTLFEMLPFPYQSRSERRKHCSSHDLTYIYMICNFRVSRFNLSRLHSLFISLRPLNSVTKEGR
jgi:hypothetical protein